MIPCSRTGSSWDHLRRWLARIDFITIHGSDSRFRRIWVQFTPRLGRRMV